MFLYSTALRCLRGSALFTLFNSLLLVLLYPQFLEQCPEYSDTQYVLSEKKWKEGKKKEGGGMHAEEKLREFLG